MFCCFGSSSAERERHRRNDRQTVSIIDAFVVPTTGQHTTFVPHPPPVSHASSRRHPVVDLDLGIDLEIAPHTVPPTPGPERHQRRLEEDRRQRTDSSRRPLPRPPSPVDPIVGRDSPVRRDGDNESIALSGELPDHFAADCVPTALMAQSFPLELKSCANCQSP